MIGSAKAAATELINPQTVGIDSLTTIEMVRLINAEDERVAIAVGTQLSAIANAVDAISARMQSGGRLVYVGAGTSGRLGVLDASEMPPTFGVPDDLVVGLIAGGDRALRYPIEGAEDDAERAKIDLAAIGLTSIDSLVGLAASGLTPYVVGALKYGQAVGALTISLSCTFPAAVHDVAVINIAPIVGPEVIAGSTRLKCGSAQKMVLNMISTSVMIRRGKTYGNLMVDVRATNIKLKARAIRIVAEACAVDVDKAASLLLQADGEVKTAIVTCLTRQSPVIARELLRIAGGNVRAALDLGITL